MKKPKKCYFLTRAYLDLTPDQHQYLQNKIKTDGMTLKEMCKYINDPTTKASLTRRKFVGCFSTKRKAIKAIETNESKLCETNYYNTAIIERVYQDVASPYPDKEYWYFMWEEFKSEDKENKVLNYEYNYVKLPCKLFKGVKCFY